MQRLIQVACVIVIVAGWQGATSTGIIDPLILPPLSSVFVALGAILARGTLWAPIGLTLTELAVAFAIATICGLLAGYAVSRSGLAVRVFEPLLAALFAVPTIMLFPLFLLFFGVGAPSKIALGSLVAFFPIALNTISGFAQVSRVHLAAARSMGASNAQLLWHVLLPEAFPVVLGGLRLGLILSFLTILGGETLAANGGLGHEIVTQAELMDPPAMFADVFVAIALALALNVTTSAVESRGRRSFE